MTEVAHSVSAVGVGPGVGSTVPAALQIVRHLTVAYIHAPNRPDEPAKLAG